MLFAPPDVSRVLSKRYNEYKQFLNEQRILEAEQRNNWKKHVEEKQLAERKRYEQGFVGNDGDEYLLPIPCEYRKSLKKAIIPNSVRVIFEEAFKDCYNLEEVYMSDSVVDIRRNAFSGCSNLKKIRLSNNLQKLGYGAFSSCTSLEKITIPGSLKELICLPRSLFDEIIASQTRKPDGTFKSVQYGSNGNMQAFFDNCSNLQTVVFENGVQAIDASIFFGCTMLKTIQFPDCDFANHYLTRGRGGQEDAWINHGIYRSATEIIASQAWKKKHSCDFKCLKAGCYIATAVYGSYDCPEVWALRRYRDYFLANTWYGRAFIKLYYAVSPILVRRYGSRSWFNKFFRKKLDSFVLHLKKVGYKDTPYHD